MSPLLEPEPLRSFLAIAETGSFTAAAQRVNRTQSAVSMQIKRLEEQLGALLFAREGRTVRLSPGGELLLPHARRILQAQQEALALFRQIGNHVGETIAQEDLGHIRAFEGDWPAAREHAWITLPTPRRTCRRCSPTS